MKREECNRNIILESLERILGKFEQRWNETTGLCNQPVKIL